MARKFNIGRQGEQLLNEEWHNLFMSLKYLNYNRYMDYAEEDIYPERQTDIPDHALKIQKDKQGRDVLKAYYPSLGQHGLWKPVFENFYHPANSIKPTGNDYIVDYRICINPKTGAIEYWDPDSQSWLVAKALQHYGDVNVFNGLNFQFISNLKHVTDDYGRDINAYPVPYVNYGKLFASSDLNYVEEDILFEDIENIENALNLKLLSEKISEEMDDNITIKDEFYHAKESPIDVVNIDVLEKETTNVRTNRGRFVSINDYEPETGKITENNYSNINGCMVKVNDPTLGEFSWVHINASKLSRIDKRLIETPDDGFINITSNQTEFYGFKADLSDNQGTSRLGTLLLKGEKEEDLDNGYDYISTMGGIQLSDSICKAKKYDYIYTLTYIFDENPNNEGYVTIGAGPIGRESQVYIGNRIEAPIALFLDGLSLEQSNKVLNETIYTHDPMEGVITFSDKDDAEIINNMQMAVLAFPKRTEEFVLNNTGTNGNVEIKKDSVCITQNIEVDYEDEAVLNYKKGIPGYRQPMVFCSGLGLQESAIFEDFIILNEDEIKNKLASKVKNIPVKIEIKGLILPNEPIQGFVADIGTSFMGKGKLYNGRTQYHEKINEDTDYVVFVNGLLLTPTNGDMAVENGFIDIINSKEIDDTLLEYVVLEVANDDDNKMGLAFDETVSYHSVRIDDGGDKAVYNDCNSAVVYVQNGIIIDKTAIEQPINTIEGYYKGNQIIKVPVDDNNSGYKYYKYDFTQDAPEEITDKRKIEIIDYLIGYYSTLGSIHLLGNSNGEQEAWQGCSLSYYAYSFANMIDEPMSYGRKKNFPIPVADYENSKPYDVPYKGQASRFDAWNKNCSSLSTYINGLIVENVEVDLDDDGAIRDYTLEYPKFYIPTDKNYYGKDADLYVILKQMYNRYKSIKDEKEANLSFSLKFEDVLGNEVVSSWPLIGKTVSNYFRTETLAIEALKLAVYIHEDMKNESTSYVIERLERNEFQAAYRDFIYLETGADSDHSQIYRSINDTIETDFKLAPATVNVYQNGVLLQPSEYCRFNNNLIMFNTDVCGLQQLPDLENMVRSIPEHVSKELRDELENVSYQRKNVLRIIEDAAYYIPTSSRDTILIEKRDDTFIKSVTFEILATSYNSYEFTQDYYDIPSSLMNSADYIKIYINGVRYEGEYILTRTGGINGIKLLDTDALVIDPIYTYFNTHPDELIKYKETYNKDYTRQKDNITFEWR